MTHWCRECHKPFTPVLKLKQQVSMRYCSLVCYQTADQRRNARLARAKRAAARQPLVCPSCHETFMPDRSDKVYCSHRCAVNAAQRRRYWRNPEATRADARARQTKWRANRRRLWRKNRLTVFPACPKEFT